MTTKPLPWVINAGTHGYAFGPTPSGHQAASPLAGRELYTRTDCRKNLPAAAWSHLAEFNFLLCFRSDRPTAVDIFHASASVFEKLS